MCLLYKRKNRKWMVSITRGNTNQTAIRIVRDVILESNGYQKKGSTTNSKIKLPNDIHI